MFVKSSAILMCLTVLPIFGQYIHEGECRKDVEVVQDFNLEKYMVKWYEIQRYEVYFQRDSECSVSRFDKETDGSIIVQNSWLMKNNPRRTLIEGSVTLAEPSLDPKAGKLIVSFNKQKPGTTANYLILDTDYQNYSIAWHCYSVGNGKVAEVAWILSRTPSLNPDVEEKVNSIIEKYLDKSQLRTTKQDKAMCGY